MLSLISRIAHAFDVDRAVLFGLLTRIWSAGAGPLTALIIAVTFSPLVQGYYYTFLNLLAFQIVLELGLGSVITVFASHEWAKLKLDERGAITGEPQALSRLASLARFALYWYAYVAAALALGLATIGIGFFTVSEQGKTVQWLAPWIALCGLTAVNVLTLPLWALLQGCGQIAQVNFFRLVDGVIKAAALWMAMLNGAGLWAIPASLAASVIWTAAYAFTRHWGFVVSLLGFVVSARIAWRREILPVQWRIGVSWISGYLMFALITPALFYFQGPVIAGQMGMTWAFVSGITSLATPWLHAKTPRFGMLVASQKYSELDQVVYRTTAITVLIATVGELCVLAVVAWINAVEHPFATRVLPLAPAAILALAETLNLVSIAQSSYLRAFKQEPFVFVSLICGTTVGASVIIFAKHYGPMWVVSAYLLGIAIALAWGSVIFVRFRRGLYTNRPA